jgi:hypothetical protein
MSSEKMTKEPLKKTSGFGQLSFDEELHLNGRHDGYFYPMDNKLVYHATKQLVLNSTAYSCIMRFEKKFDGPGAFKALERNYMGPHVTQLIQRQAENIVNTSFFNGSSKNHTFDKHVNRLRKGRYDIELCGLDVISERTKVEKLLGGFQDWSTVTPPSMQLQNFAATSMQWWTWS